MDMDILNEAFFQARLKINRADRHRQEAEAVFAHYVNTDFCRIIVETDAETGQHTVRAVADKVPADLVLAIGDAFHNLSSSLDYIMTGMMRAASLSTTRIGFPSDETRRALRKSFMRPKAGKRAPPNRRIVERFPALVLLLLTRIKPYKGGGYNLWEVRKADNVDKHNLIIPVITVTELRGVDVESVNKNFSMTDATFAVNSGGVINALKFSMFGPLKITKKGQPSAKVNFPDTAEVFAGSPVFPTLLQCVQALNEAINLIEISGTRLFTRN